VLNDQRGFRIALNSFGSKRRGQGLQPRTAPSAKKALKKGMQSQTRVIFLHLEGSVYLPGAI
jgi:hypothetical protein